MTASAETERLLPWGHLHLSPDLTRSPIRRTLQGQAYAGHKAYRAAYATAVFGR